MVDIVKSFDGPPLLRHAFPKHYLPAPQIELHFVHQTLHEKHATTMALTEVLCSSWIWQSVRIKAISLVCNGNEQLRVHITASEYVNGLGRIFTIAVKNRVRQSLDLPYVSREGPLERTGAFGRSS